jgi:hypothetical protein
MTRRSSEQADMDPNLHPTPLLPPQPMASPPLERSEILIDPLMEYNQDWNGPRADFTPIGFLPEPKISTGSPTNMDEVLTRTPMPIQTRVQPRTRAVTTVELPADNREMDTTLGRDLIATGLPEKVQATNAIKGIAQIADAKSKMGGEPVRRSLLERLLVGDDEAAARDNNRRMNFKMENMPWLTGFGEGEEIMKGAQIENSMDRRGVMTPLAEQREKRLLNDNLKYLNTQLREGTITPETFAQQRAELLADYNSRFGENSPVAATEMTGTVGDRAAVGKLNGQIANKVQTLKQIPNLSQSVINEVGQNIIRQASGDARNAADKEKMVTYMRVASPAEKEKLINALNNFRGGLAALGNVAARAPVKLFADQVVANAQNISADPNAWGGIMSQFYNLYHDTNEAMHADGQGVAVEALKQLYENMLLEARIGINLDRNILAELLQYDIRNDLAQRDALADARNVPHLKQQFDFNWTPMAPVDTGGALLHGLKIDQVIGPSGYQTPQTRQQPGRITDVTQLD